MTRSKKIRLFIIITILACAGGVGGILAAKNGWGDQVYSGIRKIDWVMIGAAVLETLILFYTIICLVFNKGKAGGEIFSLYHNNYKTQVKSIIFELIILVFDIVVLVCSASVSVSGLCAVIMISVIIAIVIINTFFISGLHEKGLLYGGKFYTWEKVISCKRNGDNFIIFSTRRNGKEPLELKFYVKSDNSVEVQEYAANLITIIAE